MECVDSSQSTWLIATLQHLLTHHGCEVSPDELSQQVFAAQCAFPTMPLEQLTYACSLTGLHAEIYALPLQQILTHIPRYSPLVLWHERPLMIVRRKRFRVLIQPLVPGAKAEWISLNTLKNYLTCLSLDDQIECVFTAPIQTFPPHHEHIHLSPLRRLAYWLQAEKSDILYILAYALAVGLLSLIVPVALQALVNTVAFGNAWQPILVLSILALIGLGFSAALNAIEVFMVELLQQRLFIKIAHDISWKMLHSNPAKMLYHQGTEWVNRFFDVVTVQKSAAALLLDGVSLFLQASIGMLVLAFYHPFLLIFDVFLLFSIGFILFGLGIGTVKTSIKESKIKYEVAAWLEELARHSTTFRSKLGQHFAAHHMETLLQKYLNARQTHFRKVFRQNVSALILQAISSTALLGIGGWLVIERQLSIGQLVAAELIVASVAGSFSKFGKHLETWYDLIAAVDKIGHLLDTPTEAINSLRLPPASHPLKLEISNVSFNYPQQPILFAHLNLTLEPGAKAVIWCDGTAGKSTFCDLLFGYQEIASGHIWLDGIPLSQLNRLYLRNDIALIRHIELFQGTIRENILLGNTQYTEQALWAMIDHTGLREAIEQLPNGLDTRIDVQGFPLSAGQARRLMFARALVRQPRLIVVDETLDSIELIPQGPLLKTLFAPTAPWTLIVISKKSELRHYGTVVYQLTAEGFHLTSHREPEARL